MRSVFFLKQYHNIIKLLKTFMDWIVLSWLKTVSASDDIVRFFYMTVGKIA